MSFISTLQAYRNACYPAVWITTYEEDRAVLDCHNELKKLDPDNTPTIYEWDCVTGLSLKMPNETDAKVVKDTVDVTKLLGSIREIIKVKEDTIFILKDFHLHLNKELKKAEYVCLLKKLFPVLKDRRGIILFLSGVAKIPVEIVKDIQMLDYRLPAEKEIAEKLEYVAESINDGRKVKLQIPETVVSQATAAAKGLTSTEIENTFAFAIVKSKKFDESFVSAVFQEKILQIKKAAGLTYLPSEISFDNVGGLTELKKWIQVRKNGFSNAAKNYGLPFPRGVGLSGFAGTGKTLSAKAIAKEFGFPLFQLNIGSLFGKYVGDTEGNTEQVIKVIESIGSCVILIDEVEKYLSTDATSGRGDTGTSSRSFGTILSWLSDRTNPALIVYTTNNHTILPDALIRKGRFDELFWVDLPNAVERAEILKVVITKYKREVANFDLKSLVQKTANFTGAEIDNLFSEAMFNSFSQGKEINEAHIDAVLETFIPQALLYPDKVEFLRNSVKGQLRLATLKIEEAEQLLTKNISITKQTKCPTLSK